MTEIYLISPQNFDLKDFSKNLEIALKTNKIKIFQLRVKNKTQEEITNYCTQLNKICKDYDCKFILNDNFEIVKKLDLDGVHLGEKDSSIQKAKSFLNKNSVIGASCYDSKEIALKAYNSGANQLSFGTFFPSITKNSKGKPDFEIISWAKETFDAKIIAIGGINDENCLPLIQYKADFLAIISYIWQHQKGIEYAINSIYEKF